MTRNLATRTCNRSSEDRCKANPQLRVLAVTNMLPTQDSSHSGRFVQQQIEGLRRIGLDVEVLFVDRRDKGMPVYIDLPALLKKKVALFQPDIIHVMYGGIMAWLVTHAVPNIRVIITFHGSDLLGQPFERPVRRIFSAIGVFASRQAVRRCSGVVLVAEHLMRSLPKNTLASKVQVIPCGIDLNLFEPLDRDGCCLRLGWKRDTFHILFQNTGDPVKRPALAYAAVERLKDLGVKAELHELCGIPYEQVSVWLNGSDALLVTSFHEGSPTIVKEALACNLPIVSVAVGDISQRIQEIEGCHISASDATELARKLQYVHMNPCRVDARRTVHSVSVDHCARRLSQFYSQLIERMAVGDEASFSH